METVHPFFTLGMFLILLGIAFVLVPIIGRYVDLSGVPSWLIYVYSSDGFYFVTSPFLIILSLVSILIYLLTR
ncbi:MAG: hypothetical protein QW567_03435 [Candidatus Hadarchaeales archaeon]